LGIEAERLRGALAGADGVARAHREAVDIGAVEIGHVDAGHHRLRQHSPKGLGQGRLLAAQGAQVEVAMEAGDGLVAVDHLQELLLAGEAAEGGFDVRHWSRLPHSSGRPGLLYWRRYTVTDAS